MRSSRHTGGGEAVPPRYGRQRALPRFLAIQGAYERLVDGEGRLRQPSQSGRATRRDPGAPIRRDPGRQRDAWRAHRSGSGGTAGATGTSGTAGPSAGSAGGRRDRDRRVRDRRAARARDPATRPRPRAIPREHHARRGPRATPGSTSYDEAAEPLDPDWDGGAWYGPSSGTYWTLNPREYADPRKHGPEYQARARRAAQDQAGESAPGADPEPALDEAAALRRIGRRRAGLALEHRRARRLGPGRIDDERRCRVGDPQLAL